MIIAIFQSKNAHSIESCRDGITTFSILKHAWLYTGRSIKSRIQRQGGGRQKGEGETVLGELSPFWGVQYCTVLQKLGK